MFDPQKLGSKKFGQNISYIDDMEKCNQDKCCMNKCHPDEWHLVKTHSYILAFVDVFMPPSSNIEPNIE